jgi:hypothetical protein
MRLAVWSSTLAILVILSNAALAQEQLFKGTARDIGPGCQFAISRTVPNTLNQKDLTLIGVCVGSISTLVLVGPLLKPNLRFCPYKNVTLDGAIHTVLAFMDRNPQHMNMAFSAVAALAMLEAWPCRS